MKVVHVVSGSLSSGAPRGALWLHRALVGIGVDSCVLSNDNSSDADSNIYLTEATRQDKLARMIRKQFDSLPIQFYAKGERYMLSTGIAGYPIHTHPQVKTADVVNLHWVNNGLVNLADLKKINKPIVWTLRDMWPMTGVCHYALDCLNYKEHCGMCPQLNSHVKYDLSRILMRRKIKVLSGIDITAVGISNWISGCARESTPFRNKRIEVIHNTIDMNEFQPVDKASARTILGIPDRKCILVGAQSISAYHKGANEFVNAMQSLPNKKGFYLVAFGEKNNAVLEKTGVEFISLGYLHDVYSLRLAYSAADVFVAPSTAEAFGKTLTEAMACGTPVVAFDATGPKDIVDHQINGYLAKPFEPSDLARGIEWVIYHPQPELLAQEARHKCEVKFAPEVIARKYLELYTEILSQPDRCNS